MSFDIFDEVEKLDLSDLTKLQIEVNNRIIELRSNTERGRIRNDITSHGYSITSEYLVFNDLGCYKLSVSSINGNIDRHWVQQHWYRTLHSRLTTNKAYVYVPKRNNYKELLNANMKLLRLSDGIVLHYIDGNATCTINPSWYSKETLLPELIDGNVIVLSMYT